MISEYFYRLHVKLDDPESNSHLAFDFKEGSLAIRTAQTLFNACDITQVWVELVQDEKDTTNSPMWRN